MSSYRVEDNGWSEVQYVPYFVQLLVRGPHRKVEAKNIT